MKKTILYVLYMVAFPLLLAASNPSQDIVVPFEFKGHHLTVQVKINDASESFTFLVDTGGLTFIDKKVAAKLKLKQKGPMAKINVLHLGDRQIEKVFCLTTFNFDLLQRYGYRIHGIIGSNLMERYRVTFDYATRQITFTHDASPLKAKEGEYLTSFSNHPINNAPIIALSVNGNTIESMVDTGQPYALVFPMDDYKGYAAAGLNGCIQSQGLMVKWPLTRPEYNILARVKELAVDTRAYKNVPCLFAELPPMLAMPLLGNALLEHYTVTIDYPRDKILLAPREDVTLADNVFSFGLGINIHDQKDVFIEGVWSQSPADAAGLQPGERVVAFNGKAAGGDSIGELQKLLRDDSVTTIVLQVAAEEGTRQVTLEKARLFGAAAE